MANHRFMLRFGSVFFARLMLCLCPLHSHGLWYLNIVLLLGIPLSANATLAWLPLSRKNCSITSGIVLESCKVCVKLIPPIMGITKRLNFCQKILINNIYFAFNHVKIISKKSKKKGSCKPFQQNSKCYFELQKRGMFF